MRRTVFITGASRGIGRAAALLFQREGWNVCATMRAPEDAGELARLERVACLRLDVTDAASVARAVGEARSLFGPLDVVVNNAGYGLVGPFEASTPEQVERQFATNVFGLLDVTRAVLPHLRERRGGVLVNVASMSGRTAFPLYSVYHATKWAVEGFSESLQHELRPFGVRVKLIEPGPIRTDFYTRSQDPVRREGPDEYEDFCARAMRNMGRAGAGGAAPDDVARVIYRAATDGTWRLRYQINARGVLWLRRLLPDFAFNRLVGAVVLR